MFNAVNNMEYITLKVGITMFNAVNNMEGWHQSV